MYEELLLYDGQSVRELINNSNDSRVVLPRNILQINHGAHVLNSYHKEKISIHQLMHNAYAYSLINIISNQV